jgi:hypothetical protein
MPQSKDLASESGAMRRIEAAYQYAEGLNEKAKARVLSWAFQVFHEHQDDEPEQAAK